jgi:hypothetical protein
VSVETFFWRFLPWALLVFAGWCWLQARKAGRDDS